MLKTIHENAPQPSSLPIAGEAADVDISLLNAQINAVNNSTEGFSGAVRNNDFPRGLVSWLKNPYLSSGRQAGKDENDDGAGIQLNEILCEGDFLRVQAESLNTSEDERSASYGWRGGPFKCFLIGMFLLTGTGVLGYAGRRNTSAGTLEDSFGNHPGPHDSTVNGTGHSRRYLAIPTPPTTVNIIQPDDVKIVPLKACYEYFGMGRAGGRREIPCQPDASS